MENWIRKERLARLTRTQHGRITWAQLRQLGLSNGAITSWIDHGHLVRVLPKVYAVGHVAPSREADLWAGILYAGPGAMLSHGTAAHWRGLIDYPPPTIEVATPRDIKSTGGVKVYARRQYKRDSYARLPVAPIPETVVDLAATSSIKAVRRALANLDYRRELDLHALEAICTSGRRGSKRLREALQIHQPEPLRPTTAASKTASLNGASAGRSPSPTSTSASTASQSTRTGRTPAS